MCRRFLTLTVKTQQALHIPIGQNENEFTFKITYVTCCSWELENVPQLSSECVCGETSFTLTDPFFVLFSKVLGFSWLTCAVGKWFLFISTPGL